MAFLMVIPADTLKDMNTLATQLSKISSLQFPLAFKENACDVSLTNISDQYAATKLKTTAPEKYKLRKVESGTYTLVREVELIPPQTTCNFSVRKSGKISHEIGCDDKLIVESILVPFGKGEDTVVPTLPRFSSSKSKEETYITIKLKEPIKRISTLEAVKRVQLKWWLILGLSIFVPITLAQLIAVYCVHHFLN